MGKLVGEPILEMGNLTRHFDIGRKQFVHAVDGINLTVSEKEILGLVGESGLPPLCCGIVGQEALPEGGAFD